LRSLPTPPIVIGHCFGGMITQLLVDRNLAAAAVALNVPPAPGRPLIDPENAPPRADPVVDYGSMHRAPLLLVSGGLDVRANKISARATPSRRKHAACWRAGSIARLRRLGDAGCDEGWNRVKVGSHVFATMAVFRATEARGEDQDERAACGGGHGPG